MKPEVQGDEAMNQRRRWVRAGGLLLVTAACVRPAAAQDVLSDRSVLTPVSATEVPPVPTADEVPAIPAVPYEAEAVEPAMVPVLAADSGVRRSADLPCADAGCAESAEGGFSAWMQRQRAKWRDRMYGYPEEFQRPPVGMAVHGLLAQQRQQAQPARMTLYRYDFKAGSSELNDAGQARLARISRLLPVQAGRVLVEASGAGPVLDSARRESVRELLAALNTQVAAESVQTLGAPEFSLDSDSALLINANRLQQTKSRGSASGAAGASSTGSGGLVQ